MWGRCGTILEKEAICTGEGLNCEPDALRPPFRDLLGSCPSSPPLWAPWPLLALAGPSWPCPKSPLGREKVEPLFGQLLLLLRTAAGKAHLSHRNTLHSNLAPSVRGREY